MTKYIASVHSTIMKHNRLRIRSCLSSFRSFHVVLATSAKMKDAQPRYEQRSARKLSAGVKAAAATGIATDYIYIMQRLYPQLCKGSRQRTAACTAFRRIRGDDTATELPWATLVKCDVLRCVAASSLTPGTCSRGNVKCSVQTPGALTALM